jgi:hypothetical protein
MHMLSKPGFGCVGALTAANGQHRAVTKAEVFFEAYVLGYLDGFSMGRHSEFWKADGRLISDEAVYLWLDEHCKANPLQAIQSGLFVLFTDRANDTSN